MTITESSPTTRPDGSGDVEHVDVLVIGAAVSGIDAAHHLRERFPDKTFAILEKLPGRGGTRRRRRPAGLPRAWRRASRGSRGSCRRSGSR